MLRRGAPLELPSADEIKATARRIAKAALLPPDAPPPEAEALPPEAPPPELPPPAPAPEPAACLAEEPCPIFRALIDAAMSDESKPVILWAFHIAALRRAVSIASREWSLGDVDVDETMGSSMSQRSTSAMRCAAFFAHTRPSSVAGSQRVRRPRV